MIVLRNPQTGEMKECRTNQRRVVLSHRADEAAAVAPALSTAPHSTPIVRPLGPADAARLATRSTGAGNRAHA